QTQVRHRCKSAGGVEINSVSVWSFLTFLVHARAFVLNKRAHLAETTVGINRKHRDAAAGVVRNKNCSAGCIGDHVTRRTSARALPIYQSQPTVRSIERKGTHASVVLLSRELIYFVDCVEVFSIRVKHEERWILRLSCEAHRRQTAGCGVEFKS